MNPPPGDSPPAESGPGGETGTARLPALRGPTPVPARPSAPDRLPALPAPTLPDGRRAEDVSPPEDAPALGAAAAGEGPRLRSGDIVAGRFLVTVGAPWGSEVQPCPAERLPEPRPTRAGAAPLAAPGTAVTPARAAPTLTAPTRTAPGSTTPGSTTPGSSTPGTGSGGSTLLERGPEVERLHLLLSRGRSIRLTGPSGSGRSALLAAVADRCADLAPDGVVRLTGYRRTPADLLHDLFAATHHAPGFRPDRRLLPRLLADVGAVVVIDDLDFGGAALDELLDSAPECAFLISTTPDTASPAAAARLEECTLGGLSRTACLELLAAGAGRPLDAAERVWAVDLWFESEGLPLRFVQAGALLRHRDAAVDALAVTREEREDLFGGVAEQAEPSDDPAVQEAVLRRTVPLPSVAESAAPAVSIARGLSDPARAVLELAVALGGECPTAPHLPALIDVNKGRTALGELVACGLAAPAGEHHRLTIGVRPLLAMEWRSGGAAHGAAQHFAWWVGHSSVTAEQVAAEAEVLIAVMYAGREAGRHHSVILLARAAAPAFALALRWGAWEQTLRLGLEAARAVGAVADEAWFHHELGVLALVMGTDDRARVEFDAAVALRRALGDTRGSAATGRMLTLVAEPLDGRGDGRGEGTAGSGTGDAGLSRTRAIDRAIGRAPWRRSSSPSGGAPSVRRRKALAGAAVGVLLAAVGTSVGLATSAGNTAPPPASTPPVVFEGVGAPVGGTETAASPSGSPSASSSPTAQDSSGSATGTTSATGSTGPTDTSPSASSTPSATTDAHQPGTTSRPATTRRGTPTPSTGSPGTTDSDTPTTSTGTETATGSSSATATSTESQQSSSPPAGSPTSASPQGKPDSALSDSAMSDSASQKSFNLPSSIPRNPS